MDGAAAFAALLTPAGRADPYPLYRVLHQAGPALAVEREVVAARATGLLDGLRRAGGTVDFMDAFAFPLPIGVICALLGVPAADHGWFRARSHALAAVLEMQVAVDEVADAHAGAGEIERYLLDLVAHRRRSPADDLTTALVRAGADGDRLAGDELIANLLLLLVAGFETTTNLLGNGLVTMLAHPSAAAALRGHPDLAAAYVEELLRHDPPVQLTSRLAADGLALPGGPRVEPGTHPLLLLGAANRDPGRFHEPDRFDPWRADAGTVAFGAGPHYCLGAALARLEAQVAFPMLLRALPGLALAGAPRRRDRLTLRGYAELPVTLGI